MTRLRTPSDDTVFSTARHVYRRVLDLPVDADDVWAGLTTQRPLSWCRALDGQYTSDVPYGVGATRTVTVSRVLTLHERFFVWDNENRHHSFYVEHANVPVFGLFAEDYRVTPTATGCQFTWTFAMEARPGLTAPFALAQPIIRKVLLDGLIRDTFEHFA